MSKFLQPERLLIFCIIGLSFGVLFSTTGCNPKHREVNTNVLLITIDTLRADHLGCYGYKRKTSPNIDRFAATATLFVNTYCQMPTTTPSMASILTSTYPRKHGLVKNGWRLSNSTPTLAEILRKNGYITGAVVSAFPLDAAFGLNRGFDQYDAEFAPDGFTFGHSMSWEGRYVTGAFDQRADVATQKAIAWLKKNGSQKFFLWLHYFDPHTPYIPPEPYASAFLKESTSELERRVASYDGEILFTDEEVEKVLDYLRQQGIDSKTLIIIMSDHGEGLGQHGFMGHGPYLYDEQTRIPLLMRLPRVIPEGQRIHALVESIDISPTVLDLLGLKAEKSFSGQSLVPVITNPEKAADRPAFLERRKYDTDRFLGIDVTGENFALRYGNMKYIWAPTQAREELYDLTSDPGELANIVDNSHSDLVQDMRQRIRAWKANQEVGSKIKTQTMDQDTRDKLRSLGYID